MYEGRFMAVGSPSELDRQEVGLLMGGMRAEPKEGE
jgi:hypothetical protein